MNERGNALLAVTIVVLALAGLSAAFLQVTMSESAGNSTAEQHTRVLYVAEAGVTHAVSEILAGGDGNVGAADARVSFGGGEYWAVTADLGGGSYRVTSYAVLNREREAIEVVLAPEEVPLFAKALYGDLDLGAKGDVFTDSYDSALGSYAAQAVKHDPLVSRAFAGTRGDLGSNRNILVQGSVEVLGNATPGPGYAVQISGTKVYIRGSTAPAPAPTAFTPLKYEPPIAVHGSFSKASADVLVFPGGVYRFSSFSASKGIVGFQGKVTLYVDAGFSLSGTAQIVLLPDSSLTIYHNGDTFSLTGQGAINRTQVPANMKFFSTAKTVKISGNSTFYGAVYAPNATVDPTGTSVIYGSFVGRSIDITGTADFHYDAALSREVEQTRTRLKRVSWRRVPFADM